MQSAIAVLNVNVVAVSVSNRLLLVVAVESIAVTEAGTVGISAGVVSTSTVVAVARVVS